MKEAKVITVADFTVLSSLRIADVMFGEAVPKNGLLNFCCQSKCGPAQNGDVFRLRQRILYPSPSPVKSWHNRITKTRKRFQRIKYSRNRKKERTGTGRLPNEPDKSDGALSRRHRRLNQPDTPKLNFDVRYRPPNANEIRKLRNKGRGI